MSAQDSVLIVNAALAALNEILTLIAKARIQSGLTDEELLAQVDAANLANAADIKGLLAL